MAREAGTSVGSGVSTPNSSAEGRLARPATKVVAALILSSSTFSIVAMWFCLALVRADVLIGPVMATRRLTFYYWGQNRLANLVPLLSFPVRDFTANFYVQSALFALGYVGLITLVLAAHFGWARIVDHPWGFAMAALAVSLLTMLLLGRVTSMVFVFEQIYALSHLLVLSGVGLVLRQQRRGTSLALGALLIVVSIVVNPSLFLFGVVAVALALWEHRRDVAVQFVVIFGGALVVAAAATRLFGAAQKTSGSYVSFSPRLALRGLPTVLHHLAVSVPTPFVLVAVVLGGALVVSLRRDLSSRMRRMYVLGACYCVAWTVLFSGSRWVNRNDLHFRYFFPMHLFALSAIGGGLSLAALRVLRHLPRTAVSRAIVIACAFSTFAALWALPRVPSPKEITAVANMSPTIEAARKEGVAFVVGDYWPTWAAVFALEAEHADVLGVTFRGEAVVDQVRRRADELAASVGSATVLCFEATPERCAQEFSDFLGSTWRVSSTGRQMQSIVTLVPAEA